MSSRGLSARPALLFDLDGTLVDSVYQHVLAWRQALGGRRHRHVGPGGSTGGSG